MLFIQIKLAYANDARSKQSPRKNEQQLIRESRKGAYHHGRDAVFEEKQHFLRVCFRFADAQVALS